MRTNKIDNKKERAKSNDKGFTMILNKFVWLMNLSLNCCGRSFVYCFLFIIIIINQTNFDNL